MKIQAVFLFLFLLGFCTVIIGKRNHKPEPVDNCEKSYMDINGTIRAHNKTSTLPNKICNWYVSFNGSNETDENHTIFLVFDQILLGDKDTVTIFSEQKPLKFFDGTTLANVVGIFPVLTGRSNITITVDTTRTPASEFPYTKSLQIHYYSNSECKHVFIPSKTGIFQSPMYDHDSSAFPIQCSFTFAVPDKSEHYMNLWFDSFIFNKGEISIAGSDGRDGKYNTTPPVDLLVKDLLQVNVTVFNQSSAPEMFKLKYNSVAKLCSVNHEVTQTSQEQALNSPSKDALREILSSQEQSLSCLWLINAEEGKTITLVVKDSIRLPEALDSLLVLDGPNRTSAVLLDLTSGQKPEDRVVYSSGSHLWIAATSPFVSEDFYVEFNVSLTQSGGHLHGSGDVRIDQDTTFLLDVEDGKQVKFQLDLSSTKLLEKSVVSFYKDFLKNSDPFVELSSTYLADVVVSPTEKMAIVTKYFDSSHLKGSFVGIDKGCYEYGVGSGDTFSVKGHCNSTCAWIVQPVPNSKDVLTFHFQTISLNKTDQVVIRQLDSAQTLVANISSSNMHFPDVWLPAVTGTFVQVTRSSCPSENTVIQASYQISSGCGTTLTPGLNDKVEISSPNYPSHYPLGANCTWIVLKPENAVFLHVSIKDLQLAQEKHTLQIFSGTGSKSTTIFTSNFTNKELPEDLPVFDNLTVTFLTNIGAPQESLPGFNLVVTAVAHGSVSTSDSGIIQTPSFPQPVSDNLFNVWFVTVKSTDFEQQIVEYTFDNSTDVSRIEGFLKIYDGASLRSPLVSNFTNMTALSRTNKLLFVYKNTLPGPNLGFSLGYKAYACNMSMLCDNKICMHEDWVCNDENDCGDYSDERDCEGRLPYPPTPEPSPSKNVQGATVGVLTGSIFAAFVFGAILSIGVSFGYRKWRSKQLFTYDPVNS